MLNLLPRNNIDALQQSYIQDLMQRERAKMDEYIKAREYYDGIQQTQLTDRMREFLHVDREAEFTVNYCTMVVNAKADRLKVTGFESEEDAQSELLWQWWRKNRMDRVQGIVHRAAVRDGDAYVLVEWDNVAKMPRFYYESAYAGEGVMVYYSDERRTEIEFATKSWQIKYGSRTGKARRKNLYFPNRIEKYISDDNVALGNWQPYLEEGDGAEIRQGRLGMAGVTWWTDNMTEMGEPLGIPIVHFKHADSGENYGRSHLANVMPLQDAVNKSMIDLLAAMDSNGFPLLVGYGSDWTGVKVGPGAIASMSTRKTEGVQLDKIEPMTPEGLLNVYNALVMEIGRISGTPLSYFQSSGHVASEGTMKQQEVALVSQVQKAQTDFGNAWEDCMIIARRLNNVFGDEQLDAEMLIETVWDDAETRNEKALAETLAIKVEKLGVTEMQAQSELGYDATQIMDMRREKMRLQALALRGMTRGNQVQVNPSDENQNLSQTENEDANNDQPRAPTTE